MSRYCGKNDSAPILSAANHWKDEAFLADGSVFDSRALWTVEGLEALETHFVRNLDEGGGTFIAKLEGQGHPLTIATVDLSRDWLEIRAELLEVLGNAISDGQFPCSQRR